MKFAALALLVPGIAFAQADIRDGPIDAYFQLGSVNGVLESCSIVFSSLTRDHATNRGAQVLVNGSIAYRKMEDGKIFFSGKLGTRMFPQGEGWEAPAHFFFATKNRTTAGHAVIAESDTPGYRLLIAPLNNEAIQWLKEFGDSGEFTAGFNRRVGGQDVLASVKINVALQKDANGNSQFVTNNKTGQDFFDCLRKLLK